MRTTFTLFIGVAAVAAVVAAQTASLTPDALLQRGVASYREGHYAEAAKELRAASDAMLSDEQMQTYVDTGQLPNIENFETALVYLTLAETKLGNHERAKEAVVRLETAERIESVYPRLHLAGAEEFPSIAARLVPGTKLNTEVPAAAAQPAAPAAAPASAPASERAERQREIDAAVAKERARIQKEADQRIATEREAAQRADAQQVAATHPAVRTDDLVRLRQADAYADNGQLDRANDMYLAIANAPDAPRDIVAEAGVGLYRTSAFNDAVTVFRKLIPFARGEEDLRYYNAVSLYETGDIAMAKRELECALPFIVENDDVTRYRTKIEQTAAMR